MKNQNSLLKIVETLNVLGAIENCNFSCESKRFHDDYSLNITIFKEVSDNDAMMIFKDQLATMSLKIRLDSVALFSAYSQLNEEEKIPENQNIANPCLNDKYMNSFIERDFLQIVQNLKSFNGISDNYDAISRHAGKCYGYHFGKIHQLV